MRRMRNYLPLIVLFLAGCGGVSGFVLISDGRLLVSLTVSPTVADPVQSPSGQVQFTAAGNFNMAPMVVNPMSNVVWTVDRGPFSMTPDMGHATISPNGVAQCAVGFIGTVQVIATAAANSSQPASMNNQVVGTARLNCP
ncbi:MAG TPA: hypothetical protein VFL42_13515 [Terriglobales bacterium]|nr:hypothetical protein [Terriglobales bacterium]